MMIKTSFPDLYQPEHTPAAKFLSSYKQSTDPGQQSTFQTSGELKRVLGHLQVTRKEPDNLVKTQIYFVKIEGEEESYTF
jgi:hypothetical protein